MVPRLKMGGRTEAHMAILLQVVGFGWAVLGVGNMVGVLFGGHSSGMASFGLVFNVVLFVLPGLVVGAIGYNMMSKRQPVEALSSVDPVTAPPARCPRCGSEKYHSEADGRPGLVCDAPACGVTFFSVALLLGILLVGPALAAERSEVVLPNGGTIEQCDGRAELFDAQWQRGGYGVQRRDGSWDLYNKDSTRRGYIAPGRDLSPARVQPPNPTRRK
jgi:hypothetical protein